MRPIPGGYKQGGIIKFGPRRLGPKRGKKCIEGGGFPFLIGAQGLTDINNKVEPTLGVLLIKNLGSSNVA